MNIEHGCLEGCSYRYRGTWYSYEKILVNYVMLGGECVPDGLIDTSELFDCELCRKHFRCHNDLKEGDENSNGCEENYVKYAMTEL